MDYSMIEIPLFTNLFHHQSGGKKPQHVTWLMNSNNNTNIEVYCEDRIFNPNQNDKNKYGWICESSEIIINIIKEILKNKEELKKYYKKIFTCDKTLIQFDPNFFEYNISGSNVPWVKDYGIFPKNKLCSFITSFKSMTSGHQKRLQLFQQLKDHPLFKDHIYGREYNPITNKETALKEYMFSIAMENSKYPTYFTEKVTDCFATGTIPIYYGHESISEYFNPDGIIFIENFSFDKLTPDFYHSKMNAIQENFEKIKSMETADDLLAKKIMSINTTK